MNKPIIIAICGKSATGKDSTAQWLSHTLTPRGHNSKVLISDTTRPPRENEEDGVDYYFIDPDMFIKEVSRGNYLEWTKFRHWYYGVHRSEVDINQINIGVFNLKGLEQLYAYRRKYNIVVVYLKDKWWDRLRRSRDREGRWRIEHFRRLFVDWKDFLFANKVIQRFRYNITLVRVDGVVRKSRQIISHLLDWRLIEPGQKDIIYTS